ncbi:hypothetical protein [Kitasatospora sp. HPMI-4]|uniref:hypothetical protein n=1 Tax=Kitasatospora sp. HPMI-4 TaxID=3448443 RepID=UPI003F1DE20A
MDDTLSGHGDAQLLRGVGRADLFATDPANGSTDQGDDVLTIKPTADHRPGGLGCALNYRATPADPVGIEGAGRAHDAVPSGSISLG